MQSDVYVYKPRMFDTYVCAAVCVLMLGVPHFVCSEGSDQPQHTHTQIAYRYINKSVSLIDQSHPL